MSTFGLMDRT